MPEFPKRLTKQAELDKQKAKIFKGMILHWAATYNSNGDSDKIMQEILESARLIRSFDP